MAEQVEIITRAREVEDMRLLITEGEDQEQFYNRYQRLILKIANKVVRMGSHVKFDELVQAGAWGLLVAKERYISRQRGKKKSSFSSYAYHWIQGMMLNTDAGGNELSLDNPGGNDDEEEELSFYNILPLQQPGPDETLEAKERSQRLWAAVDKLPPRLKQIILWRIEDEKTLEEIGEELSLTRERVRQLQASALQRLRKQLAGTEL